MTQTTLDQHIGHLILERRDRNDLAPLVLVAIPVHQRQQRRFILELVDLIQQQQRRLFRSLDQIEHETIAVASCRRSIANQAHEVDTHERILDRRHHAPVEFITGLMDAGSIDKHHLAFRLRDDSLDLESSGLWFIGDRGNLLAHESIQQSRLPGIGPTDQRDITTVSQRFHFI